MTETVRMRARAVFHNSRLSDERDVGGMTGRTLLRGEEFDAPEDLARDLVANGIAERVDGEGAKPPAGPPGPASPANAPAPVTMPAAATVTATAKKAP